jgi:hypothetical protein
VWLWPSDEPAAKDSVAEGAANALLHGIEGNLVGMHRFAERGHTLRLMPPETLDGVTYQVVEVVFRTGHTSYFYIDPVSWQITRKRDERSYHPDADATQKHIESRYSDFKTLNGVVSSDRNEDYDLGTAALLSTNQVTARIWNPSITPGVFDRQYVGA